MLIELESGETCNFDTFGLIGCRIEVSDNETFNFPELSGKVLPKWSQGLAVTAPRSIELNKDLIRGGNDLIVESSSNDDLERVIVVLWDVCALEEGSELTCLEVIDEIANCRD